MTKINSRPRFVQAVRERRLSRLDALGPAPFTRSQALAAGLSDADLRAGFTRAVERGVHVRADVPLTHELRCAAAALRLPEGGRLAGVSAAALYRLPVPDTDRLIVSVPRGTRFTASDHVVRHHDDAAIEHVWISGLRRHVPVTSREVVLAECLDHLNLVDSVVLADALLGRLDHALGVVREQWATSRDARLRRVGKLSDVAAESAQESRTRLLIELSGLPRPDSQISLWLEGRERRVDLGWKDFRGAVEYDGAHHYVSDEQKHEDILRTEQLDRAGWLRVPVVARGIYRDPASTVARIEPALRSRGCPARATDEWRRHFPQRV